MAFQASIILPNSLPPKTLIKLFGQQQCRVERYFPLGNRRKAVSKCAIKVSMSQFVGPDGINMQKISITKEKLGKLLPESVKEIEWNKAADLLMEHLLSLGQKIMKWSIVALFALSSLSDVVLSISRNQELMIPFGLLVGCLTADFFKEISHEVFPSSQEGKGLNQKLISMGCFFVLVKFMSAFFGSSRKFFLLHVANGGIMQVLWLWRSLRNPIVSLAEQETLVSEEVVVEDKF